MTTRREAMQAGIGGAVIGALGGAMSLGSLGSAIPSAPYPTTAPPSNACNPTEAIAPLIPRDRAWSKVLGDAFLRTKMRATLYERYRHSVDVDPDIAVLKSISPMAKITLTRQRRVEREIHLAYLTDRGPGTDWTPMRDWLELHVRQLMWGNDH